MYIPIMKNRQQELIVTKNMNKYFSESIIPLIEVIKDKYQERYKIDPVTGKFVYEKKPDKKNRSRIKLPRREEDIITLGHIQSLLDNKLCFIDFFRFYDNEYSSNSFKGVELPLRLRIDFNYYKERLLEISRFENLIPVISIKTGSKMSQHQLFTLFYELKDKNDIVAIRLTDDLLEEFSDFLSIHMSDKDFIMLDIREQNAISKIMELEEFQFLETKAKKVLLNSPRLREYRNKNYENLVFTTKINNIVANLYKEYEFDGFGDFGGLKDDLPAEDAGGNGTGAALSLMFLKDKNSFFSIVNADTSVGVRGYKYVSDAIKKHTALLDKDSDCPAIKKIKGMDSKYGSWKDWNNITLTRYIHQQATK